MKPLGVLLFALFLLTSHLGLAASTTWVGDPFYPYWDAPSNWTPETVPNGPEDVATFGVSTQPRVYENDNTTVDSIVFNPGASAFAIWCGDLYLNSKFTIGGAGIINDSGQVQIFYTAD